jgi:chitinase
VNPPPAGNQPPGVAIITPTNGATFTSGQPITIEANVSDADGFVTQVQFFAGASLIGTVNAFPFQLVWSTAPVGPASLTAVATDNVGATTVSTPIAIAVLPPPGPTPPPPNQPPSVSISSPTNGSTFTVGTSIDVQIEASDPDGSITLVELFQGATHLGSATSAPVHITWTPMEPGIYSLRAVATDNDGASSSTGPVTITIQSIPSSKP